MKYVLTPTSQLPNRRDQGGRFFSLRPCDFCKADGVKIELREYIPKEYRNAEPNTWLRFFGESYQKQMMGIEDFNKSRGFYVRYFCSEECSTLFILQRDGNEPKTQ